MWTEITRPQTQRKGLRNASDVTEADRQIIEPWLPAPRRLGNVSGLGTVEATGPIESTRGFGGATSFTTASGSVTVRPSRRSATR